MAHVTSASGSLEVIQEDLAEIARDLAELLPRVEGRTLLITGASGVLPAYMADFVAYANDCGLLKRPARLLLLVRKPIEPGARLEHLQGRLDVRFLVQDVCAPLVLDEPIHLIVHAASNASPRWYRQDPVGTLEANASALSQLLTIARASKVESFLYFSSSEIYGSPESEAIPTSEIYIGRTAPAGGRACYTEAKRFGEALCVAAFEQYGTPIKIVRPFHVHGPGLRLDDGRIVAEMIAKGLREEAFELLSDGKATRTYGYVADATAGFFRVLLSDENGEAFNIGTDAPETSILELAGTIASLFGRSEGVRVNPDAPPSHLSGAPMRVCPDLSKARERVGYQPRIGLEEGLRRTIRWHQARRMEGLES